MSGYALVRDSGAYVLGAAGVLPQNSGAATVNGSAIDRGDYQSCVVHAMTGTATGSPSAQSHTFKLQDSPDGSTDWNDLTDVHGNVYSTEITADETIADLDVKLGGAKKYIRVVATVAFTDGSSPANDIAAVVALAGVASAELPV